MTGTVSTAPVVAGTGRRTSGGSPSSPERWGRCQQSSSWRGRTRADQHYSYPFDATSYTAAPSWFAVQHLGLLPGPYGLGHLPWSRSSRLTRAGLTLPLVGMVGMVGLTACELFAIGAAHARVDTSRANAVDSS
jgi:hypothetical protein